MAKPRRDVLDPKAIVNVSRALEEGAFILSLEIERIKKKRYPSVMFLSDVTKAEGLTKDEVEALVLCIKTLAQIQPAVEHAIQQLSGGRASELSDEELRAEIERDLKKDAQRQVGVMLKRPDIMPSAPVILDAD